MQYSKTPNDAETETLFLPKFTTSHERSLDSGCSMDPCRALSLNTYFYYLNSLFIIYKSINFCVRYRWPTVGLSRNRKPNGKPNEKLNGKPNGKAKYNSVEEFRTARNSKLEPNRVERFTVQ